MLTQILAQVAIAWILSKGAVVLIGARTVEQLEENIEAVDVNLKPSQIKELDELTELRSMYPNWMIERQNAERVPKEFIEPF